MRLAQIPGFLIAFLFLAPLAFNACATLDTRTSKYESLKKQLNQVHDSYLFKPGAPYLFDDRTTPRFIEDFMAKSCPEATTHSSTRTASSACDQKFGQALARRLSERYFAAEPFGVAKQCQEDPMICSDPRTFEELFRRLHNSAIEESRALKLQKLEDWRARKIDDQELSRDLHIGR